MVAFSIKESGIRSTSLMEDCQNLKQSHTNMAASIYAIKLRVGEIERSVGVYTGEDKHLVWCYYLYLIILLRSCLKVRNKHLREEHRKGTKIFRRKNLAFYLIGSASSDDLALIVHKN